MAKPGITPGRITPVLSTVKWQEDLAPMLRHAANQGKALLIVPREDGNFDTAFAEIEISGKSVHGKVQEHGSVVINERLELQPLPVSSRMPKTAGSSIVRWQGSTETERRKHHEMMSARTALFGDTLKD